MKVNPTKCIYNLFRNYLYTFLHTVCINLVLHGLMFIYVFVVGLNLMYKVVDIRTKVHFSFILTP